MEFYQKAQAKRSGAQRVSIPNGMEFYWYICELQNHHPGFNSQRDGILRDSLRWWRRNSCFNSQRDGILPDVPMFASDNPIRFNSQRDGILRVMRCLKVQRITVSIPNGMEFYYAIFRINVRQRRVSIPNGMEFYWNRLHQKDHWQTLFQFPTGWNSTLAVFK